MPASVRAADLWAVVEADGKLVRHVGAVSSQFLAHSQYEVIFNRDVQSCAYVVTVGSADGKAFPQPGWATVTARPGNAKGVAVQTHNHDGGPEQLPFHLFVSCRP
jgi:hypothetical protein